MAGPRSKRNEKKTTPLRRSVGRPRRGDERGEIVKFTTSIPAGLAVAIDNEADDKGTTRSALMCELLAEALEARWK